MEYVVQDHEMNAIFQDIDIVLNDDKEKKTCIKIEKKEKTMKKHSRKASTVCGGAQHFMSLAHFAGIVLILVIFALLVLFFLVTSVQLES